MNKIVTSALALAVASSTGFAGTTGTEWTGADQQINNLALSMASQHGGPQFGALIRSSLDISSDDVFAQTTDEDTQGFRAQDARLWASGALGDYVWRLSFDFADATTSGGDGIGDAALQDAYARWNCTEQLHVTMGQFNAPTTRSAGVGAGKLLFIERSLIGQAFYGWAPGVSIGGSVAQVLWDISAQNGVDGVDDDLALSGRVGWDMNNNQSMYEGGYDAPERWTLAGGLSYYNEQDDAVDAAAITLDAAATVAGFSFEGEISDIEEELLVGLDGLGNFAFTDDATPWAFTAAYMLSPNEWEVAVRYQDLDDDNESSVITGGVNWYQVGHAAKWSLNVEDISSDVSADEGTLIRLGLSLGSDD